VVKFCDKCGKAILPSQINRKTKEIHCVCGNIVNVSANDYYKNNNQISKASKKNVKEIINKYIPNKCPKCTNDLLVIDEEQDYLIQCSNSPHCDYLAKISNNKELLCPNCDRKLSFYNLERKLVLGCSGYPICKYHLKSDVSEHQLPKTKPEKVKQFEKKSDMPSECPKCGSSFQLRQGPYGTFLGCRRYPSCKFTFNIEDPDIIYCPLCHSRMVERSGKYGTFLGCTDYPTCRYTINIKNKPK